MSKIRQLPLGKISSIQEAIDCVRNSASSISGMIEIIHFVYDSYIELCLKEACRLRRYNPDDGIELIGMTEKSEFPKQLDKFWGCVSNKEKIKVNSRKIHNTNASVVSSSIVINGEDLPALHDGVEIPEVLSWVEEGEAPPADQVAIATAANVLAGGEPGVVLTDYTVEQCPKHSLSSQRLK